ncbi:MAG: GNAT family N-acetyltransferase [Anaerolineae bacterium]|jgi:ribosomal protein S18 acetylase RimI-like enzyme|nr:GNAT family N-acetyltransferase [Anaerolineae bacterium]MBT3713174.1 GNAT family N-acetyltransferase [Anaerolineae bacterium]MBT4312525.1 GNAT family N-acetyltransferase [Anaerolineae bacterium]MBT4457648.1 GNAT family N-acetyltransferase [Anaerolineae bacterium]MBT6062334.1 GNAT family N-acetyltransferase [Anaerolineae bacterium]
MITIRPYKEKDWKRICAIHDAARPDELLGSCDPRAFVPIEKDDEVEELKKSDKFVAVDEDEVVGFVGVDGTYLAWLYVNPDYYHQGIGRRLLQNGIETIGSGAWTIVLDGNKNAISLYKSEGFIEARRFKSDNAGYPCTCLRLERKD